MALQVSSSPMCDRREAALRYLAGRIDYERTQSMPCSEAAWKLDRMRALLERLGNPQDGFPILHIAGTKGKGSTAAMLAAILSAAGYRSGLFSSPHLERIEERIAIDGQACSPEELADLVELIRPEVEAMDAEAAALAPPEHGPTYFEIVTALALCHFARRNVAAAVLEVGLGGRLDSTNVCLPKVSVITSISFDHTKQLGETLAAIAAEKAGIIKPGVPVVSGVVEHEPRDVIRSIARAKGCRLIERGADFDCDYRPPLHLEQAASLGQLDFRILGNRPKNSREGRSGIENLQLGLPGKHQAVNAAVALAALETLREGGWKIPESAIRRALADLAWPARVEVVARRPTVILDAAHNAASIAALVETIEASFCARRRILIFATTLEKDVQGMLRLLLGRFDHVFFTRYRKNPRGVPPEQLQAIARELGGEDCSVYDNPEEAWKASRRLAQPDDLVCITGSFFLAAEMRSLAMAQPLAHR